MPKTIKIGKRKIGQDNPPFIIAEIGINHEGSFTKAKKMIKDAHLSGAECVKFQCHIIEDEMIENDVVPANANESIWNIMRRCSFSEEEEIELKNYVEELDMIYLNTPFSRAAANRLKKMKVSAYKIGSGECNNFPLIKHIASFGKPIILSTGMNDISTITNSVKILKKAKIDFALMHVTSMYPTPYEDVRLRFISKLKTKFPNTVVGLSDHSYGNYTCFGAVALGASIIEKHFTSNKNWKGPDIPISISPAELRDLIFGSNAIFKALGNKKNILPDEKITAKFAYASVVSIKDIKKGESFSKENIWVKRPGTGEIRAKYFEKLTRKKSKQNIKKNTQLKWSMIND
ncbi:MAG: polyhydroxyalkanoate biosynthesis repressor PhaR [Crenarchaeota archaeon]|nr:MAG: polyhydroxyalkanoate biosynthesis repressor PhaR [Thermoproteota archaeon]